MSFTPAKINIEVWSNIAYPFCYIAKHHFEKALEQFVHKDKVELERKAYQLNPNVPENGGLDQQGLKNLFNSHDFADKVISDIQEARVFGITSVPFFVFNRKYAVSGVQPSDSFLDMLNKVYND